jgi:hypothetical protein
MRRFFKDKIKREKSPKPPQPGTPTKIVDRPPGFQAELGTGPQKGGRSLPYRDRGIDRLDLAVTLGEGSSSNSRTTSQDKKGEDQGLTAQKASTSGGVVSGTESGGDRTGECLCSLWLGPGSCESLFFSSSAVDTVDTEGRKSEPAEASRGKCRSRRGVSFPLTYISCEDNPGGHGTWGCYDSR